MRIQAMLNIEVGNTKSLKLYKLLILVIISLLGWLNMHQDISMYFFNKLLHLFYHFPISHWMKVEDRLVYLLAEPARF